VIWRIKKWSLGRLLGFVAGVILFAAATVLLLSSLVVTKSVQIDEPGETVFVSFEGHPECGAVRQFVGNEDLEAGIVFSGDPAPCEDRNLMLLIVQGLVIVTAIGLMLSVVWIWLGAQEEKQATPDPAQDRA
jgi:hypothetical protein